MRVRILKSFVTSKESFQAGQVAEIDAREVEGWFKAGLVMEDKSLDGARETKTSPRRSSRKRKG